MQSNYIVIYVKTALGAEKILWVVKLSRSSHATFREAGKSGAGMEA